MALGQPWVVSGRKTRLVLDCQSECRDLGAREKAGTRTKPAPSHPNLAFVLSCSTSSCFLDSSGRQLVKASPPSLRPGRLLP